MNLAVKIPEIFAAMSNQRTRKRRPGFFGNFNWTGNEKLVVRYHKAKRPTLNAQRPMLNFRSLLASRSVEMYASRMCRLFFWILWVLLAAATRAESPSYLVFVSNERSGDVTV